MSRLVPILAALVLLLALVSVAHAQSTTPTVSTVAVTSDPSIDGGYAIGEAIEATLTFSEAVTVVGMPTITLDIGSTERTAEHSGAGRVPSELRFSYTVAAGDEDTDGIAMVANSPVLNGGTIRAGAASATLTHGAVQAGNPIIQLDEDVTDDPLLPGVPKTYEGITLELIENTNFIMAWTGGEDNRVRAPQHEVYYLYPSVCSNNPVADPPRKPYINVAGTAVTVSWIEGFGTPGSLTHDTYEINPTTARTERLQEGQCEETNLIEDPDPIIDDIWTNGTILYAKNGHNRLLEGYTPLTEAQIATRVPGTLTTREQDKDIPIPYTMSLHVGRGISGFANSTHHDERNTIWVRGRSDSENEFTAFSMVTFKRTPERDIAGRPGDRILVEDMHFTHTPTRDLAFFAGHSPSEVVGFTLLRDSDNRIYFGSKLHTVTGISPRPKRLTGLGDHILISGDPSVAIPVDITTYNINNGETKKSEFNGQRGNESATCLHDQCTNSITTHAEGVLYLGFETNNIIYIFKNPAASFYASTLTPTLPENSPGGTTLDATFEATTQTPDSQVWSLTGTHASCFSVAATRDRTAGSLKKTAKVIALGCPDVMNYEAHENGAFNIGIKITHDNGPPIEEEIMVLLTDVDEPPKKPIMQSVTASATPRELEVVWTHPVQTDRPPITGAILRYCRPTGGASTCDPDTASHWKPEIPIPGASPHRLSNLVADTTYIVQVKATNDEGIGEWSDHDAILVSFPIGLIWYGESAGTTSPNQAPTFTEGLNTTRSMAETFAAEKDAGRNVGAPVAATDQDGGTITYSLAETGDHAAFALDSATGQLKTLTTVNYNFETNPRYAVTLIANDGQEAAGKEDRINVTIQVTDVNEAPSLTDPPFTREIDENSPEGNRVGAPIPATDPDSANDAGAAMPGNIIENLTFTISGTGSEHFRIDDDGQIRTTAELDHETQESHAFQVRVTDGGTLFQEGQITIKVLDVNEAPAFSADRYHESIDENTPGGAALGITLTASDPDEANDHTGATIPGNIVESIRYSISGDDHATFSIDAVTGELSLAATAVINYETKASYSLTVTVTDLAGSSDTAPVAISVNDLNETPSITNSTLTAIGYDENDSAVVTDWDATDPDPADTISWALTGDDALDFSISDSGQLSFGSTPDFEKPLDLNRDNVYEITITAADRTSGTEKLTDSLDARITVRNIDEPGTVTLNSQDPVVNTPITATLTDPDGSISNQSWTWSRSLTPGGTTTLITSATQDSHTPTAADINRYLTATVSYQDGEGDGKDRPGPHPGPGPQQPARFRRGLLHEPSHRREPAGQQPRGRTRDRGRPRPQHRGPARLYDWRHRPGGIRRQPQHRAGIRPEQPGPRDPGLPHGHHHGHRPERRDRHDHREHLGE